MSLHNFINAVLGVEIPFKTKEIFVYISAERAERDLINHVHEEIEGAHAVISVYENFERFLVDPLSLTPTEPKSIVFREVLNRAIAEGSITITISKTEWPWVYNYMPVRRFQEFLKEAGFLAKVEPIYREVLDSFTTTGNYTITIRPINTN